MNLGQSLSAEFQHEQKSTRALLALVPFEKADYKPHEKSMSVAALASHIVDSVGWSDVTLNKDVFVMDPEQYVPFAAKSSDELLAAFDKNIADLHANLANYPDEKMFVSWKMQTPDGNTMLEMPRIAVMRGFIMNHMIHHRAQLTVYLRMLDIPLPQVYGPTADNPNMMGG